MFTLKRLAAVVIAVLFLSSISWAAKLKEPTAEYSADAWFETEQATVRGRVFHAPGKERREQETGGMRQTVIMRLDKNLIWVIMPQEKTYMEYPIQQSNQMADMGADASDFDYEYTIVGEETVNGVRTTKSRMTAKRKDGTKFEGFMWTTKEGILVKMDAAARERGKAVRVKSELRNLRIAKQDPKLFEVPAGYKKMEMGGFGGGMENMMKRMVPKTLGGEEGEE